MKKGLSVLLIAAALFGFYGGATSLNDILASKDYWEEVGEKSTADMNKLEDGLNQLKDNEKAYLDGQKELADGEKALAEGEAKLAAGKAELAQGYADYAAAPGKLADGERKLAAGEKAYEDGMNEYTAGKNEYNSKKKEFDKIVDKFNALTNESSGYPVWKSTYIKMLTLAGTEAKQGKTDKYACFQGDYSSINPKTVSTNMAKVGDEAKDFVAEVDDVVGGGGQYSSMYNGADPKTRIGILMKLSGAMSTTKADLQKKYDAMTPEQKESDPGKALKGQIDALAGYIQKADGYVSQFTSDLTFYMTLQGLVSNRQSIYDELVPVLEKMATDEEVAKKLNEFGGMSAIKAGLSDNGKLFIGTMDTLIPYAQKVINDNKAKLAQANKKLKAAQGQLAAGLKTLNAGRAELAQGYADYAAAPGKLADGEKQVADGEAQLADGRKQLEDGKKQLAQYEDGEQQVRDGLATLMATEADPGLESILDRRNGDDKFDDANGHLDLNEGLEAVDTGRGYQADSGELITKEITNRAVGTAAGLAAGALAVLAAILSFLKKNKGAAVSAVLAAVAGGVGAGVGFSAGQYYSDIAGSTVGNTPFIAAGILAAVAAVFAIVHFTAKPEEAK